MPSETASLKLKLVLIPDSSSSQIVTKESCTIGVINENVIPLTANHMDMCRVENKDDTAYERVRKHCKEIGAKALERHTVRD